MVQVSRTSSAGSSHTHEYRVGRELLSGAYRLRVRSWDFPSDDLARGLPNNDFGYDKRSWISITGIVSHDGAGAPLDTFAGLYDGPAPKTLEEARRRATKWMSEAMIRWCDGKSLAGDQALLDWLLANELLPNTAQPRSKLAKLLDEYRRIEQ